MVMAKSGNSGMAINNLYSMQVSIKAVVDDMDSKAKKLMDKYTNSITRLPSFSDVKNMEKLYVVYDSYCVAFDEIVNMLCRLDLVITQMDDIKSTKLTRDLSNDFLELKQFKEYIIETVAKFKTYRYDFIELKNTYNHKLKMLQGLLYKEIVN